MFHSLFPIRVIGSFLAVVLITDLTWASNALSFKRTSQTIKANPNDETVTFTFPFQNNSDKPVKLESLEADCECTDVGFVGNKKTLKPGDQGMVSATMKIGMFSGSDARKLTVTADGQEYELFLRVEVPEVITLSTRQLDWEVGEPPRPKTITVTVRPDSGIKLTTFSLAGKDFNYKPITVKKGEKYRIVITPVSTGKAVCNTFWVLTDSKIPRYSRYIGMLTVTPPRRDRDK